MIIGLFKETKITWQALANKLTKLFDQYGLRKIIIAYVKDEGSNLYIMIIALKSIVTCEVLGLDESFQGICFGPVFFKACWYVTIVKNVDLFLSSLFIQSNLQKCIIWLKKIEKGIWKWNKACLEYNLHWK